MKGGLPIVDNVIPGLYASTPEPLGFGPSLEIRAFLLQRERGNLLLYRSEMLEARRRGAQRPRRRLSPVPQPPPRSLSGLRLGGRDVRRTASRPRGGCIGGLQS